MRTISPNVEQAANRPKRRAGGRLPAAIVGLLLAAVLVAACGPAPLAAATSAPVAAATSTSAPPAAAASTPAPTTATTSAPSPTTAAASTPAPTAAPATTAAAAPTMAPTDDSDNRSYSDDQATPGTLPQAGSDDEPEVRVEDQAVQNGQVVIKKVVSGGPGWLVVHAQQGGGVGPVLGYSPVSAGENEDVAVKLDLAGLTGTLYAMLHADAGTVGTYEFPGADVPVTVGGAMVNPSFNVDVAAGQDVTADLADFAFHPATLVIRAGSRVTWTNKDTAGHTVTSDSAVWDSGLLGQGQQFSFTFDQPGVYPYYCRPHGGPGGVGMSAVVVVLP